MSKADWERAYRLAWETYYTPEHMETVMRRAVATRHQPGQDDVPADLVLRLRDRREDPPLEGGYLRRKVRRDRRPGLPIEPALSFIPAMSSI